MIFVSLAFILHVESTQQHKMLRIQLNHVAVTDFVFTGLHCNIDIYVQLTFLTTCTINTEKLICRIGILVFGFLISKVISFKDGASLAIL